MSNLDLLKKNELEVLSPMMPEDILSWAAGSEAVRVFAIEEDGQILGCAAVLFSPLRTELLWFYVAEAYRGYGIGNESFFNLLSELRDAGAEELVLEVYADTDRSLRRLLRGYPISFEPLGSCHVSFAAEEINKVPELLKPSVNSVSLRACGREELAALQEKLAAQGRDLLDVTEEGYNTSISTVYKKDGEALGVLLFKRKSAHELTLSFAASVSDDVMVLRDMLCYASAMARQLPPGTVVDMNILDQKMKELMLTLLKGADKLQIRESRLLVLPLSYVDMMRREADMMADLVRELSAG